MKAWAVLTPKDWEHPDQLRPYGNGAQYQYPIFHSRAEALDWKRSGWGHGRVVRVTVRLHTKAIGGKA